MQNESSKINQNLKAQQMKKVFNISNCKPKVSTAKIGEENESGQMNCTENAQ